MKNQSISPACNDCNSGRGRRQQKSKVLSISAGTIVALFMMVFPAHATQAATYYFDSVSGNDNTGAPNDTNHPYQSIDKASALFQAGTIKAGDFIKFRKGTSGGQQEFRGQLHLGNASGSAGSPITITSYSVNSNETYKPEFNSTDIAADHSSAGWPAPDGSGVYILNFGGNSLGIFEDGKPLREASSKTNLGIDGNWFQSGGTAYYKPTSGTIANHLVERGLHGRTVYDAGNAYITFDGLKFTREGLYDAADAAGKNIIGWTVQNCDFLYAGVNFWQGSGDTFSDLTIQNNTFDYCNAASIRLEGGGSDSSSFIRVKVLDNLITHNNTNPIDNLEWAPGLEGYDNDCIPIQSMTQSQIIGNDMSGYVSRNAGITYWISPTAPSVGNVISGNYIHDLLGDDSDNLMGGIRYDAGAGASTHSIKITDNIVARFKGKGIWAVNGQDPANPSLIANNIIYGGVEGIHLETAKNYIIKNNIIDNMSGAYFDYYVTDASNSIDYNGYYNVGSGNMFFDSSHGGGISWSTWKNYQDPHGLAADPKFANASGNFSKATDFQLAAGSPAIGKGTNVSLATDYAGNTFSNPPSIGAYEYGSGTTPPPTYSSADLNQDGAVNATDFGIIKTDFLKLAASLTNPKSDIDADGQVTIKDVGILMSAWK